MRIKIVRTAIIWGVIFGFLFTLVSCTTCSRAGRLQKMRESQKSTQKKTEAKSVQKANESTTNIGIQKPSHATSISDLFEDLQDGVFMVFASGNSEISQGSGFFIHSSGIGVTNYHVLEGNEKYFVRTSNGKFYPIDEVLYSSPTEENDYVIFKIESEENRFLSLKRAKKGARIGEDIFAIGSPHGLENSLTKGTISQFRDPNLIQIDAAIEHGSSGGPLFNMYGEVIGITTKKIEGTNLNFAVDIQVLPSSIFEDKKTGSYLLGNDLLPSSNGDQIIFHEDFTVSYSEKDEQAQWVAYKIIHNRLTNIKRTNDYREDPFVKTGSASPEDYRDSGYDMGHLAPARSMCYSYASMSESFYMSNISPQIPAFNRGVWKRIEQKVRYWSEFNDSIYVVTGPYLTSPIDQIGNNRVTVPRAYYKILLGFNDSQVKGLGFFIYNQASNDNIYSFVTSIDEIERMTGIDFFHNLDQKIQNDVESNNDVRTWFIGSD